jgi:hypothetical protein
LTDLLTSEPERPSPSRAASRSAASAQLGGTLRSILVSPQAGFRAAFVSADKRQRFGARVPEGAASFVMGACGGTALMFLWLKLGGLLNLRSMAPADFRWSYVIVAAIGGALLGLIAQVVWGAVGRILFARFDAPVTPARMRLSWGASALPQAFALLILFPLDVAITGRGLFTGERISASFPAIWAALSVALSVSLAAWSGFLFWRGVQTASGASTTHAAIAVAAAAGCLVLVVAGFLLAAVGLAGAGS